MGVLSGLKHELDLEFGEQIHGLVIKFGFAYEVPVANSLINMYVKCARICLAEKVFEGMPITDVVSWNMIIGALEKDVNPLKALDLSFQMSEIRVNEVEEELWKLTGNQGSKNIVMRAKR